MSGLSNEWSKVLSPREREIFLLVGRGLSNKDVARELGLSPGTVKIHVHSIFVKLGESNRGRLVILAQSSRVGATLQRPQGAREVFRRVAERSRPLVASSRRFVEKYVGEGESSRAESSEA